MPGGAIPTGRLKELPGLGNEMWDPALAYEVPAFQIIGLLFFFNLRMFYMSI